MAKLAHTGVYVPGNKIRLPSAGLILGQRHEGWTSIKPALGQRPLFAFPRNKVSRFCAKFVYFAPGHLIYIYKLVLHTFQLLGNDNLKSYAIIIARINNRQSRINVMMRVFISFLTVLLFTSERCVGLLE